jgi:mannose-6-phosphate isomerase-like protein (cupin superfamily)
MKIGRLIVIALLIFSGIAAGNNDAGIESIAPHATVARSSEIEAALKRNSAGALSDSVLRVVPIASKYNVGIAVVRRSRVNGRIQPDALVHESVTEVYQIIEGKGVMVTGGALRSARPITDARVLGEIGPSSMGEAIVGGLRHEVGPGDIVVIPAGTPHGFIEITTARIVYTLIRIDPQRVLDTRGKPHR